MTRLFADTSYWIALFNPGDGLHRKAVSTAQSYSNCQIVTSEMVLVEILNGFNDHGRRLRSATAKAVKALRSRSHLTVISQTTDQFERALLRYDERRGLTRIGV